MRNIYFLLLLLVSSCSKASAQSYLPTATGQIVEHTYYTLSYVEEHEQPEWVYYTITPQSLSGSAKRTDDFRVDNKVATQSATLADYKGSGYDRGHLCPAASMSQNAEAISESFYMSNMSPQAPSFNRGAWKYLEERVRDLAWQDSLLHVVTGPIFTDPIGKIGPNEVTVPSYYYKVLYSPKKGEMVGFVMQNCKLDEPLDSYAVSIDEVESLTGLDLFAEVDDTLQEAESQFDLSKWVVDGTQPKVKVPATAQSSEKVSSSAQAQEDDGRCHGLTSSGDRCKRKAQAGSKYCWQHQQ